MAGRFHVALSFAGEQREYVEKVHDHLQAANVRVFYDRKFMTENWGRNILEVFEEVYSQAYFVVIFSSKEYVDKKFPNMERQHALTNYLKNRGDNILVAKFDDTDILGFPTSNIHIEIKEYSPEKVAGMIVEKLKARNLYLGKEFNRSLKETECSERRNDSEILIRLVDQNESPVVGADICLLKKNNTSVRGKSNVQGEAVLMVPNAREICTIFIAHSNMSAAIIDNHDLTEDIRAIFSVDNKVGVRSMIFTDAWSSILGIQGELSTILDGNNRTYIYAKNIAIDGDVDPSARRFELGKNMHIEDNAGNAAEICIHRISGNRTILDYVIHSQDKHDHK